MGNNTNDYTPAAIQFDNELMSSAREILANSEVPDARISEEVFKQYFLPCFAGQEPFQEKLSIWLNLAGGVHNPVQVVDDGGNPLFVVPATYSVDTFAINGRNKERSLDVSTLITTVKRFNSVNPVKANEIMNNGFHQVALDMVDTSITPKIEAEWKSIFDRYGITSGAQSKAGIAKSVEHNDEEIDGFSPL